MGHTAWPSEYSQLNRFIPTYVGHTLSKHWPFITLTVHPHIRGAYCPVPWADVAALGSSPHTWGIRRPAPGRDDLRPVHPHIRGAYRSRSVKSHSGFGSSPHTWGIRSILRIRPPTGRFIPTYVGHTPKCEVCPNGDSVHPHIRGAYKVRPTCNLSVYGSSPHTWGI